ncbi:uncharacterized protein N7503_009373 [Penicillium pulvis]|uniref:uncharacterized protein n=1 Tax=Penicillium pulvis TaxID=1562058 RepID=UPI002547F5DB|nr:uncharacterized protein N7503_009373 [Penicillium pulvis]KAJ5793395.1 hypothetical protein N7503_009373 [Penicillium pulvis]
MSTLSTMRLQIRSNQGELKNFFRYGQSPSLPESPPPRYGKSALAVPNDQVCLKTSSGSAENFPIPMTVHPSVS